MNNIYDNDAFFDAYAQMDRSRKGLSGAGEWHQLKPLFPDLEGKAVLDLGCGYGWHCRYAAECGASRVMGIDLSENMIRKAKETNGDARIRYEVCGLEEYEYPADTYDCVISNLVLHYVENLNEVYRKVHQTLKQNGIFLFNIEHPVFTGSVNQSWICDENGRALYWPVDNYFYPGERETNFLGQRVLKQHHTLTQILGGLLECGFAIEAVEEAMPPQDMMELPGMEDEMRRPMMLLVRAAKRDGGFSE
ncbi:MAG: class I SAM-dependent methyltransferase [Lachnospiraceae bacterium]|nr:class I SAM-dependent methyltransferase [Lachnospiraceae bacterium]